MCVCVVFLSFPSDQPMAGHQHLNYLNSAKFINSHVMRWAMYLQNFNIKLECIKGSENVGTDYMSRAV